MSGWARASSWVGVLALLSCAGCGVPKNVCATVGDREVELETFNAYLVAVTGGPWEAADPRVAERLFDQFLEQEVVLAAARARGDARIRGDAPARSSAVRALLDQVCGPPPEADPALIAAEVAGRLQKPRPARARVRQLLVDSEEDAVAARARLDRGEDFLAVAEEISQAPNLENGGGLGLLSQGTLPEELDDVIFALKSGEISQPVRSPAGYHIFQVIEMIPAGQPERAEVEAKVRREMAEATSRSFARSCVDRLSAEVGVRVYSAHLWFEYRGRYVEGTDAE